MPNRNLANGQLAASAGNLFATGVVPPSSNANTVNITLYNTSSSLTETIAITVLVQGGTARTVARMILAPNESGYIANLPLDPGDTLQGSTSDATTVDYVVSAGVGAEFKIITLDKNGNVKSAGSLAATLTAAVTSTSANALSVGPAGTTNPVFNVDASTSSQADGITVVGLAAGSGCNITVITSGTNSPLNINAAGSGNIVMNNAGTGITLFKTGITMADAKNVVLNATTGTKIGTATTQKLGFYNATPVVQPAANTDTTTSAAGSSTAVYLNTTFTGAGTAAYTIGGIVAALKAVGILAA